MSDAGVVRALHQINSQLRTVGRDVDNLERMQAVIAQTVDRVSTTQDMTRSELNELRAAFEAYLRRDELARNLQLAHTRIIAVRQELETRYGHYNTVRRLATGTLQGMDGGIVTEETLQATSEELMITTPGYWLAPALVGLSAWIRDDRALAQRALGEALRRDNDKTALFFALVLRRQERNVATARWLRQYVARQDAANLSREFTVVLDAVATGALGPDARPTVMQYLGEWYDRLGADRATVDAQVQRWSLLLDDMRDRIDPRFTILPQVSSTWPRLKTLYEGATVHRMALAHFRGIFEQPLLAHPDLQQRVDEILDNLVTGYDTEESPHRRDEQQLQAVIDHDGDKQAAAAAVADAATVHEDTVDLLTLLTNAAFYPDQVGASDGTRRMAIALAKDWIVGAAGKLEAANLAALPTAVELSVEGWSDRIDGNASEERLVASVGRHIEEETNRQLAQIRFTGGPLAAAIGAGIALVLALVAGVDGSAGWTVFWLLAAAGAGIGAAVKYTQLQPRRDRVAELGRQRKEQAQAQVRGAIAETVDWRAAWEREIDRAADFRTYMTALRRDAFVTTTNDQLREVLT